MTTNEAIQIIDNATGQIHATRQEHTIIAQAIETIKKAIENPVIKDDNVPRY